MDKDLLEKYVKEINTKIKDLPRFDSDYSIILEDFKKKFNDIRDLTRIERMQSWALEIDTFLVELKFAAGSAVYCAEDGLTEWDKEGKLVMDLPNILFWFFARDYFMRSNSYFDKIAGFINWYYQLGIKEDEVYFKGVFSELPENLKERFKDTEKIFDTDGVLIKMRELRDTCIHRLSLTNYRRLVDINVIDDQLLNKGRLFSIKETFPNGKKIEQIYGFVWHDANEIKDFIVSSIKKIAEAHSEILSALKAYS